MRADAADVLDAIDEAVFALSPAGRILSRPSLVGDGGCDRLVEAFRLYLVADIRAAMGGNDAASDIDGYEGDPEEREPPPRDDTEQRARLRAILDRGEAGEWRTVVGPAPDALDRLKELGTRAPHLHELTTLVLTHIKAALNVNMPITLPPVLLLGSQGTGKTWYLSRLAEVLSVPFRLYQFSSSSLGEGLTGSQPTWRNAKEGLCASMQLVERVANGLVFVDESDKAPSHGLNVDPYRPFYALLDPVNSKRMVDEFLGFPLDASMISWVMSANDVSGFPAPIVDRLTIIEVPPLSDEHRAAVAASIYQEANAFRRGYFDVVLGPEVLSRLTDMNPRSIRIALDGAMVRAAAENRRRLRAEDVDERRGPAVRQRIGFR